MKYHHNNQLVAFISRRERAIILIPLQVPFLSFWKKLLKLVVLYVDCSLENQLLEHKSGMIGVSLVG